MTDSNELSALGASSHNKRLYQFSHPEAAVLERFMNPMREVSLASVVNIEVPEFTSLCPITGQPDFAKIKIAYTPDKWCVESKSLKIYMGSFRLYGSFHEAIVAIITHDLVRLLEPYDLTVEGQFTPRGGIPFWPQCDWDNTMPLPRPPPSYWPTKTIWP